MRDTYNRLKHAHDTKQAELKALTGKLERLHREDDVLDHRRAGMARIEREKGVLHGAQDKLAREQQYHRILKHMADRLLDERKTYDNTLRAYEEALKVRREEAVQMKLMDKEVRQAREQEEAALLKLQEDSRRERHFWEDMLVRRRRVAKQREDMKQWFEERKKKDMELRAELAGDLNEDQEKLLRQKVASAHLRVDHLGNDTASMRRKVAAFEDMFHKIRLATGLDDTDAIIERYNNRESQQRSIDEKIEKLTDDVAQLKDEREQLELKLENVKFSGMGVSDFNREMVDSLSHQVEESRRKLSYVREENERLQATRLSLSQSILTLFGKLEHVRLEGGAGENAMPLALGGSVSDTLDMLKGKAQNNSTEQLAVIERKLSRLQAIIEHPATQGLLEAATAAAAARSGDSLQQQFSGVAVAPPLADTPVVEEGGAGDAAAAAAAAAAGLGGGAGAGADGAVAGLGGLAGDAGAADGPTLGLAGERNQHIAETMGMMDHFMTENRYNVRVRADMDVKKPSKLANYKEARKRRIEKAEEAAAAKAEAGGGERASPKGGRRRSNRGRGRSPSSRKGGRKSSEAAQARKEAKAKEQAEAAAAAAAMAAGDTSRPSSAGSETMHGRNEESLAIADGRAAAKRRSAAALKKVEAEEKRRAAMLIQGKIRQKQARKKVQAKRRARKQEQDRARSGNYNIRK